MLVGLLLPAVNSARESGRRTICLNNLIQNGKALLLYNTANQAFPVGNMEPKTNSPTEAGGWWGFQAKILPYLEFQDVYKMCNFSYQGTCFDWIASRPEGDNPAVLLPPCFNCPDDPYKDDEWSQAGVGVYKCTNYLGVMGTKEFADDGILLHGSDYNAVTMQQITDGASHTIILGERGISDQDYGWPYCGAGDANNTGWGDNLMATVNGLSAGSHTGNDDYHFWSYHPSMSQFVWADGSAKPLTYDINNTVFQALATKAGREIVPEQ
jgi:hypothetical protein